MIIYGMRPWDTVKEFFRHRTSAEKQNIVTKNDALTQGTGDALQHHGQFEEVMRRWYTRV